MKFKNLLLLFCLFIQFASGQWSSSVNLSPNSVSAGQNESMGSCIGTSNNTIHVVWCDKVSSTNAVIYYTHSTDAGLSWSNAVAISSMNGNSWNPAIAVNNSSIHVVWREINTITGKRSSHYIRSLDAGNSWGTNVLLDTAIANWPGISVSANTIYVVNDIVTNSSPYNTEIFLLRSLNNGATWSTHQQITFSSGRSEDEAIAASGSDVYMSWNDNRNVTMQIFYKHSSDFGVTWGPDVLINSEASYSTMVSNNGTNVDVPSAGAPKGRFQIHLNQSPDKGTTWAPDKNLTNDTASTFYYPYMVRDGADLHVTYVRAGTTVGGWYLHSADGGATWNAPYSFTSGAVGITPFVALTGCTVHLVWSSGGHIYYARNPTGNAGHCGGCTTPPQPGTITGNSSVCSSSSQTYSIAAVAGASSYTWTLPNGWTGSSTTTSITVTTGTTSGTISLTANNSCGASPNRTLSVNVTSLPAQPSSIVVSGGFPRICPGDVLTYTVTKVNEVTYNWTTPTGGIITSGQGTNTVTISFNNNFGLNGLLSVVAVNNCGTSLARTIGVYRNIPLIPGNISGPSTVCSGSITAYSIAAINGAVSYTWTAPAETTITSGKGSTAVNILWGTTGGNVSVTVNSKCGSSLARTLTVAVGCLNAPLLTGDYNDDRLLKMFPNPVTEQLTIEMRKEEKQVTFRLMNLVGQQVVETTIYNAGRIITLPLNNLAKGVYLLQVLTDTENSVARITKE